MGSANGKSSSSRPHLKDTTPDSGVVADNSHSNSNQSTTSSHQKRPAKDGSSQNSLLSSASSTAEPPIWQIRSSNTNNQANSTQNQGEETTDKPAFRWDGTPLVDKTKESHFLKKVKSMEVESDKNNQQPPKPPIRDS